MAIQANKAGIFGNNSNSQISHEELKNKLRGGGILAIIRFTIFLEYRLPY